MKYKHFLITRLNLIYEKTPEKPYAAHVVNESRRLALDPEWLERRLQLFKDWALPSVLGQSTQDFKWLLLMNAETPTKYRHAFYNLIKPYSHYNLVFTLRNDLVSARYALLTHVYRDEDWVIETNLDSDDAISKNFMAIIQREFRGEKEIIDTPRGFTVNKEGTLAFGRATKEVSAFRSLVEPTNERFDTLYATIHGGTRKIAPLRSLKDKMGAYGSARWLQILHDENLTNKLARKSSDKGFPPRRLLAWFDCPKLEEMAGDPT